jgi:hypothetical protein
MRRKPILLVGGVDVSSIMWTAGFVALGMLLMLGILILLAILGWRGGL